MKEYLAIVDLQNDFIYNEKEGGAMGVGFNNFIVAWNNIEKQLQKTKNLILTADCHPVNHCSFKEFGGLWNKHCIKGTAGYSFYWKLYNYINTNTILINKAKTKSKDEYGVDLLKNIKEKQVQIYITGLCWDYCVSECAKITAEKNPKSKIILLKNCSVAIDKNKKLDFSKYKNIEVK